MRKRRWTTALGVVLALALGLGLREWLASGEPESGTPGTVEASSAGPNSPLSIPPVPRPEVRGSGALTLSGTVTSPAGAAAQATVSVSRVQPGETLSDLGCSRHPAHKLLTCNCTDALEEVSELVHAHAGEEPVVAQTGTDAAGHYQLEGLQPGDYTLHAEGTAGMALRVGVSAGQAHADLVLQPAVQLSGRVEDEQHRPIAGEQVTALPVASTRYVQALTGADGHFTFPQLPRGAYYLQVSHPGLLPLLAYVFERNQQPRVLTLLAPRRLGGHVMRDGRPVEGADVKASGPGGWASTRSDPGGGFVFTKLGAGRYRLEASQGRDLASATRTVEPGHDLEDVELDLEPGVLLEGRVHDGAEAPVADARVSLRMGSPVSAVTDATGHFSLGPVRPGELRLNIAAKHFLTHRETLEVSAAKPPAPLDVRLDPALSVDGLVVDGAGTPLEGAYVEARLAEPKADGKPEGRGGEPRGLFASSDAKGAFELDGMVPGSDYLVSASHRGFESSDAVHVRAPRTGLTLTLHPGNTLTVEVVDEHGQAVAGVRVETAAVKDHSSYHRSQDTAVTDAEGHASFHAVPAGRTSVTATQPSSSSSPESAAAEPTFPRRWEPAPTLGRHVSIEVTMPASQQGAEQTVQARLVLAVGQPIQGHVLTPAGAPVAGAEVEAKAQGGADAGDSDSLSAVSAADGSFVLAHAGAGAYELIATKSGWRPHTEPSAAAADPVVEEKEEAEPPPTLAHPGDSAVVLVLEQEDGVHGRVVHADGSPVTRFSINGEEHSDAAGRFTVASDTDGDLRLVFDSEGLAAVERVVSVQEHQNLELPEVTLREGRSLDGKAVDADTGAPLQWGRVVVTSTPPSGSKMPRFSETLASTRVWDGDFELEQVGPDARSLTVTAPGYAQLTVPLEAGSRHLTLRLTRQAGRP